MHTVTFDTPKFVTKPASAGVPAEQAEAITEAFGDDTSEELLTRDYLDSRLEAVKSDIIKWVAALLIV